MRYCIQRFQDGWTRTKDILWFLFRPTSELSMCMIIWAGEYLNEKDCQEAVDYLRTLYEILYKRKAVPVVETSDNAFGQAAYTGYLMSSNGVSLISGASLPKWPELPEPIQRAWIKAAKYARGVPSHHSL